MNRRGFLQLLGMSVGGLALDQAIPFNRVWSFPSKIVVPKTAFDYSARLVVAEEQALRILNDLTDIWNSNGLTRTSVYHEAQ